MKTFTAQYEISNGELASLKGEQDINRRTQFFDRIKGELITMLTERLEGYSLADIADADFGTDAITYTFTVDIKTGMEENPYRK